MNNTTNMPKGFYISKKKDIYEGMLTKKQQADLEGETILEVTPISTKQLDKLKKQTVGTNYYLNSVHIKPWKK